MYSLFQLFGHRGPCYASEWSEVNPDSREMVVKTVNVSEYVIINIT